MSLGTHENSPKTYLTVGFGKLRQKSLSNKEKVTSSTPGAVMRETASGNESWALEYDYITGVISYIQFKEDRDYGNSYEVVLKDGPETFQLSFKADSRYWVDFMKKLPNIDLSQELKITIYDFEDKTTQKRKAGTSVEQNSAKVLSFYDKKDGDNWSYLYGYPDPSNVNWKNKKSTQIYLLELEEFLHEEFMSRIFSQFDASPAHEQTIGALPSREERIFPDKPDLPEPETNIDDNLSDLPF